MLRTAHTYKLRTRLSDDRRALVEGLVPLAIHVVMAYARARKLTNLEDFELFSVAFEAMVDHAEMFDPSRSSAKSYFAAKVRFALSDYVREKGWRNTPGPRVYLDLDWELDIHRHAVPTPASRLEDRDHAEWLLSRTIESRVLRLVYVDGLTHKEAAQVMGTSTTTAANAVHRGLADIRASLASRRA